MTFIAVNQVCLLLSLHNMMTSSNRKFSALLAICAGNSPVPGEFPAQRPVTRSFDVFFDLRLNKRLSKQSWGWWFKRLWCPLWRHCNETTVIRWHVPKFVVFWLGESIAAKEIYHDILIVISTIVYLGTFLMVLFFLSWCQFSHYLQCTLLHW